MREPARIGLVHGRSRVFIGRIGIGIGVFDKRDGFLIGQCLGLRVGERIARAKHGTRATRGFHEVESA